MNPAPSRKTHLFCTCFKFGDRYFDVNLYDDGFVHCYDRTAEDQIEKADSNWHNKTDLWPDPESMKLLNFLHREFTVCAKLPAYDLDFMVKKLLPGYRRQKFSPSTEGICIHAILLQFFWKKMNSKFCPPVPKG